MKAILTLSLLILLASISTEACSPPLNYERIESKLVLANIDLVILARFTSQDNFTETINNFPTYLITLNTQVDCILRNKNNVSVARNIKITDFRGDNWENINTCTEYLYDIRFNTQAAIGIEINYNRPSEFAFTEYNFQGPYYYLSGNDKIDIEEVMWVCGFQDPVVTTGGNCPSTLPQDVGCVSSKTARLGRPTMKTALILPLFTLPLMLYTSR